MTESTTKAKRRHSGQPTIGDVARVAGCSPMTVSRVINNEPSVRAAAREKVLEAIRQLNYFPNSAARNLAGAPQTRIALLFTNPSASYLSELLMGSLEQARQSDIYMVVERCEFDVDEVAVINRLVDNGITGFLMPSPLCDKQSLLDLLHEKGARVVLIGPGKPDPNHSAVMINEYQAAYDMTAHIIGLGHKRIGFIIGNPYQTASGQRLNGFIDAMHDAGLEVPESMVVQGLFTYRSGFDAAARLIDQLDPPTAIFASNDDMAAGAVAVAHRRDLDVPANLTICGFDDTAMASIIWPELTTIRQPISDMSRRAVEVLADELKRDRMGMTVTPQHVSIEYQLIRRQSDAAPGLKRKPARRVGK